MCHTEKTGKTGLFSLEIDARCRSDKTAGNEADDRPTLSEIATRRTDMGEEEALIRAFVAMERLTAVHGLADPKRFVGHVGRLVGLRSK